MTLQESKTRAAEIKKQIKALKAELEVCQMYPAIIEQIEKAGYKGRTIRDLIRYSRNIAKFEIDKIESAVNELVEQGEIKQEVFDTPSGRGRKRVAYVINEGK